MKVLILVYFSCISFAILFEVIALFSPGWKFQKIPINGGTANKSLGDGIVNYEVLNTTDNTIRLVEKGLTSKAYQWNRACVGLVVLSLIFGAFAAISGCALMSDRRISIDVLFQLILATTLLCAISFLLELSALAVYLARWWEPFPRSPLGVNSFVHSGIEENWTSFGFSTYLAGFSAALFAICMILALCMFMEKIGWDVHRKEKVVYKHPQEQKHHPERRYEPERNTPPRHYNTARPNPYRHESSRPSQYQNRNTAGDPRRRH